MEYLAHIRENSELSGKETQSVAEHCRNTAKHASSALESVSLSKSGYLAGLIHDMGKYTTQFQDYLINGIGARGSVNHTFAAVKLMLENYHAPGRNEYADIVSELLAIATGGHHGLFDCIDEHHHSGFQHRLDKTNIGYDEAKENFFEFCANMTEIDDLFKSSEEELEKILAHICEMTDENSEYFDDETAFYSGLLARLLLSAVIDGDRRDTAEFMNGAVFPIKRNDEEMKLLWEKHLIQMEEKLNKFPQIKPIDKARRAISDKCRDGANLPSGVFRLNVPTGGGKTLSGLRYALAHAQKYGKQRIIFTSPLLSILEQNAAVIRDFIQDDSIILEHHSNVVNAENSPEEADKTELLAETWESPIIITTLVQLLNTLFSGKTTAIRRFHSLCNSIIVIDEVQTVPSKMLTLFSLAVNFLSEICGTTVVLCSATQPCLEKIDHPLHNPIRDLVPFDPDLWSVFKRTEIKNLGSMSTEEIADKALRCLETSDSILIVCNKKDQANRLFNLLKDGGYAAFSLSAAMCTAHRRDTLEKLRASLSEKKQKVVCVSTQVIEAGVDISFECVIRFSAGMDSVVQSAGRCNRSGEAGAGVLSPVYVVQCQNESLARIPDIQRGKDATQELLTEFENNSVKYKNSLDSEESIGYYYRALYRKMAKGSQDYIWDKEEPSLFSLLSRNDYCTNEQPYYFCQAFKTAGFEFKVFEENTTDVIVPYGKGKQLILDLNSEKAMYDSVYLKSLLEQAKPYTVAVYEYQLKRLNEENAVIQLQGGALGLGGYYSEETGFSVDNSNLEFLGVM